MLKRRDEHWKLERRGEKEEKKGRVKRHENTEMRVRGTEIKDATEGKITEMEQKERI